VNKFEPDENDTDRDIESYPGLLGYTASEFPLKITDPILRPLEEIDWDKYSSLADFGETRTLSFKIDNAEQLFTIIDDRVRLEEILEETNLVDVQVDCPEDQVMTTTSFYLFFKKASVSDEFLKKGIRALVDVLRADIAMLIKLKAEWSKAQ
jgi:hypothetical protein